MAANINCEQALWTSDKKKKRWTKLGSKSLKKNCEQMLLTRVMIRFVKKSYKQEMQTIVVNTSCEQSVGNKECWTKVVNKSCEEKFWIQAINKSCEKNCEHGLGTRIYLGTISCEQVL